MRTRTLFLAAAIALALFFQSGCAANRTARAWEPGERIICPGCGHEFTVPEKLGR